MCRVCRNLLLVVQNVPSMGVTINQLIDLNSYNLTRSIYLLKFVTDIDKLIISISENTRGVTINRFLFLQSNRSEASC